MVSRSGEETSRKTQGVVPRIYEASRRLQRRVMHEPPAPGAKNKKNKHLALKRKKKRKVVVEIIDRGIREPRERGSEDAGILECVVEDGLFYRGEDEPDVGGIRRLCQADEA